MIFSKSQNFQLVKTNKKYTQEIKYVDKKKSLLFKILKLKYTIWLIA